MQCGRKRSVTDSRDTCNTGCRNGSRKKRGVRTLVALLLFFLISVSLTGIEISSVLSLRTPKDSSQLTDYLIGVDCRKANLFNIETEYERENGINYRNLLIELFHSVKLTKRDSLNLPEVVFSGKRFDHEASGIDLWQADVRLSYKSWNIGFAQVWENSKTNTNLVIGKVYQREWGIPYLIPISIDFRTDALTKNLRDWNTETKLRISLAVSSMLDLYVLSKVIYYGDYNWLFKAGLTIKLRGL